MSELVLPKVLPFLKDIPRYGEEPRLKGAPAVPEESIFNNPAVSRSAGIISNYVSESSNSRQRRDALSDMGEIIKNPESRTIFYEYMSRLQGSSERAHVYDDLLDQLKRTIDWQRNDIAGIPEKSSLGIPPYSIFLANACLKSAYGIHFGLLIPPLTDKAVRVVVHKEYEEYFLKTIRDNAHSAVRKAAQNETVISSDKAGGLPDFAIMVNLPGRPIFFSDDMIKKFKGMSENVRDIVIAFWLIHENMHRAAKEKVISLTQENSDRFSNLAFAALLDPVLRTNDPEKKKALHEPVQDLAEYIDSCSPIIKIEGAIVTLYGEDTDGLLRQVVSSGYDLNEKVVTLLTEAAEQSLFAAARKNLTASNAKDLIEILTNARGATTISQRNISEKEVQKYLSLLGLTKKEDLFLTYVQGRLPLLHLERLQDKLYLV